VKSGTGGWCENVPQSQVRVSGGEKKALIFYVFLLAQRG